MQIQIQLTSSDGILVIIKAFLRFNSWLLGVKITLRSAKRALLGKFAYPVFRLLSYNSRKVSGETENVRLKALI
jgi:hypothetical protein